MHAKLRPGVWVVSRAMHGTVEEVYISRPNSANGTNAIYLKLVLVNSSDLPTDVILAITRLHVCV